MIDRIGLKCCGCGACASICPKGAIAMERNAEGFQYPRINAETCIRCELCEKACPVLFEQTTDNKREAWGCVTTDQKLLRSSSSGGVFSLLAESVLSQNGVVFGAAFTKDFYRVEHIAVFDTEGLKRLRGSKYLQSELKETYPAIKERLIAGKMVLFSGTPCQVTSLKSYLGKEYEKLLCVDIICHGVPSPLFWEKYLRELERKKGGRAASVSFRHKENGWHKFGMDMQFNKDAGHYYKSKDEDPFMKAFLKNCCLRESCYQCAVKGKGSRADITIGDFWGIEKLFPDRDNCLGTSLVILHTEKGATLFDSVQTKLQRFRVDCETALKNNIAYDQSVMRPMERDAFFIDLGKKPVSKVLKKYTREKWSVRVRKCLALSPIGKLRRAILHRETVKQQKRFQYGLWIEFEKKTICDRRTRIGE